MPLGDILRIAARRTPRKTAVIAGGRQISFDEYHRQANRFSRLLIHAGVGPGDRVGCLMFNSPEYGIVHFGSARAGSVLVHIPPFLAPREISDILRRTGPRILVVDPAVENKLTEESRRSAGVLIRGGGEEFAAALAGCSDRPPERTVDAAAPVAMTFTGGTTGGPKGVVVSRRARLVSAEATAREHGLTDEDIVGVVTPMSHAVGLMIWWQAAILVGATSVIFRQWGPADFVAATERRRISSVFLVPVQVRDLLRSAAFHRRRLASLRKLGVGGAPTPPGLIAECRRALPHCGYTDHYGQSETGPLTILKPVDAAAHAGTVGRPASGVELRIVDRGGRPVPVGAVGEIVARGPFLMEEYFGDEAETARYFRDGWGWTGDLARADEDGFITLVGRSRELIISGGFNIYPAELEAALGVHPAVRDCAVFGVPDERWGESPVACVVRTGDVAAEELIAHCTARLARYKRPREVVFVDRIPRTPSGKVRKPILRDAYLKGAAED